MAKRSRRRAPAVRPATSAKRTSAKGSKRIVGRRAPKRLVRTTRRAPAATQVQGIDVSKFQGAIDWSAVGTDAAFAFMKATEGATLVDVRFAANWQNAATRVVRGAYHYFTWKTDADAQADNFIRTAGALSADDLPPVLDLEERAGIGDFTVAQRVARVTRWLERMKADLKRLPVLYVQRSFMVEFFGESHAFADYPLFVVDISQTPPRLPAGWPRWTFWQHSQTGAVSGIQGPVDLDRFNGDALALGQFIQSTLL